MRTEDFVNGITHDLKIDGIVLKSRMIKEHDVFGGQSILEFSVNIDDIMEKIINEKVDLANLNDFTDVDKISLVVHKKGKDHLKTSVEPKYETKEVFVGWKNVN